MRTDQYILLARLFQYPKEGYRENVNRCMNMLRERYPDAAESFTRFHDFVNSKTLYEVEEIFNITFHIQAICFLDLGYVLFGEDYKRGEFLVNMKREQAKINHDCGEELADNLPNVLILMAISNDKEFVEELAIRIVRTDLKKMLEEFKAGRMELRAKIMKKKHKAIIMEEYKTENITEGNVFQNALQSLLKVLEKDYQEEKYNEVNVEPSLGNFLHSCGTC
jgi:nitrate reductase assembly molybdenum cofactor insertion protein NarJ